jgi:hypothetical protein
LKKILSVLILVAIFLSSSFNLQGQATTGRWTGIAKQDTTNYSYAVKIAKVKKDSIWGSTISRSFNFYSETKFKGIVTGNIFIILESEIIRTNYKGTGSLCLLKLVLKKNKNILQGSFTSSNQNIKDCGSGTVLLELINEKKSTPAITKDSNKSAIEEVYNRPQRMTLAKSEEPSRKATTIQQPNNIVSQRKIETRNIEVLNTFRFKEDSVMIKIFDNGVIDGDVITLIINGNIVFDKIKLSTSPITYILKANNASQFQIDFYADTLGDIPPNTGLITISSASKTSEALFLSDLKKTSAIKLILNNIY